MTDTTRDETNPLEQRTLEDLPPQSSETVTQGLTEDEPIDPEEGRSGAEIASDDFEFPPNQAITPGANTHP